MKYKKAFIISGLVLVIIAGFSLWQYGSKKSILSFDFGHPASGTSQIADRYALGSVKKDITYCNSQKLDIYEPRIKIYDAQPLVIYIHGGGWRANNKAGDAEQRALIDGLRDKGYAIASIDYRQQPNNTFPAPVEDVLCAVRFLRASAVQYQLNPNKFAVFGYSAGGHLAAMIGVLDSKSPFNNGLYANESSRVKAVVTLAGVFDFNHQLKTNSKINIKNLMQKTPYEIGQPISYVTAGDSPFLLVHGTADSVVLPGQDQLFAEKLRQNVVPYDVLMVKNAEHGLSRFGGELLPSYKDVSSAIQQFIEQRLSL